MWLFTWWLLFMWSFLHLPTFGFKLCQQIFFLSAQRSVHFILYLSAHILVSGIYSDCTVYHIRMLALRDMRRYLRLIVRANHVHGFGVMGVSVLNFRRAFSSQLGQGDRVTKRRRHRTVCCAGLSRWRVGLWSIKRQVSTKTFSRFALWVIGAVSIYRPVVIKLPPLKFTVFWISHSHAHINLRHPPTVEKLGSVTQNIHSITTAGTEERELSDATLNPR